MGRKYILGLLLSLGCLLLPHGIQANCSSGCPSYRHTDTCHQASACCENSSSCSEGSELTDCVCFNPRYSYQMLDHTENLRKVRLLLHAKRCGYIEERCLYTGFSILAIADYQRSSADSKFAYLMRHPTSSNQIGKEVSEAVLHSGQFQMTAAVANWLTGYGDFLYDPEQSFGSGTITDLNRNQVQLRKGYVLFGDLDCSPLYFAVGKMDTPFGQTSTVNPFTSNTVWHAFGGLAYGALLGYDQCGFNASFMAIQGGAQFRAHHAPVRGTNVPSRLNNYVADANFSFDLCEACFKFGASYTRGSAYLQNFPVQHFHSGDDNVPAWSGYGQFSYCDFLLKGSFAQTTKVWPGTHNPNPPLDVFAASKVSSFDVGAKYMFWQCNDWKVSSSAEFSRFKSGPKDSPWERQDQIVLGFSGLYNDSSKLFTEFVSTKGYVPLNFISGGNLGAGETHSRAGTDSFIVVIGAQITL